MLGFASRVSEADPRLNLLRITQGDFFEFLRLWARWCGEADVRNTLNDLDLAA